MIKYPKLLVTIIFLAGAVFAASCASNKTETAKSDKTEKAPAVVAPAEPIKITVGTSFDPKSIEVKKGQPVKLAFVRKDTENCGDEVVFPSLDIKKTLPVGETVTVEFTPQETGEIAFNCGMSMMKGKVIVQ